jgi:DNA-binding transcriptional LysR family regulator
VRGNDFMELRAFELVARRLSFSRAADEIGISRAALSQIVKSLEVRLGIQLLNRTTRSVGLTDAGYELLERLSPALNELVNAVGNIEKFRDRPSGRIRVLSCHLGADLYLKPMLPGFSRDFPDVTMELHIDDSLDDIVSRGFDAAVRPEGQIEMDMIGVKLGSPHEQIMAVSANYVQRAGRPQSLADLNEHRCIGVKSNMVGQGTSWRLDAGSEHCSVTINGPMVVNNHTFALQMVLADMGIAVLPQFLVANHLESGRVERLFPEFSSALPAFYLCHPKQSFSTIAFRSFVDYVQQKRALVN